MPRYGVNRQIIVGSVGADAELLYLGKNETPRASFGVAATVRGERQPDGTTRDRTEWFTCVLWGKRAEALSPYLFRGLSVYVEGRTETRSWEDDEGATRTLTEVQVENIVFLGSDRPARRKPPAESEAGD